MRPWLPLLVALPLLMAGCATPEPPPAPTGGGGPAAAVEAPWWNIGESWTLRFTQGDSAARTTTLAVFANNTFGDPEHFWLGTAKRQEALDHVFFDDNMFLGRIHWGYLAPHEKGRHSDMYSWPLEDGKKFAAHAFGKDWTVTAKERDGGFDIEGRSPGGASIAYDYDLASRWFSRLEVKEHDGSNVVKAHVVDHEENGATGRYYFLRGRDYLDSDGGTSGSEQAFEVTDEGATSIAFLLDGIRTDLAANIEFVSPDGEVYHRETIRSGTTTDKVVEVPRAPTPGTWKLRFLGDVDGTILVRGIIEYKATIR